MAEAYKIESLKEDAALKEKWISRWGDFPTEAMRDPAYNFFMIPGTEGLIGFKEELGCAVTFGDPICPKENIPKLSHAFHAYCQEKNLNIAYLIASEEFSKWAIKHTCNVMLEIGEELIFDPQSDPLEGPRNKLRNKVNHAQHLGLKVEEYTSSDPKLEKALLEVGQKWLKGRKGPQIYLSNLDFFENRKNKRWFYVKDKEQLLGVAVITKLEHHEGWLLKFLMVLPDAPRGTSEWLMIALLETLRKENCRFLTYGMVPSEHLGEVEGIGECSKWFAKNAFKMAKWIFNLEKRKAYWLQFHPKAERSYILFEKPRVGIKEVRVVLKSLKVDV